MSRKGLNLGGLDDFTPRRGALSQERPTQAEKPEPRSEVPGQGWNRREAPQESQFTIRARLDVIERFKARCRPPKGGRYTYGEMLEILLDETEEQGGRGG